MPDYYKKKVSAVEVQPGKSISDLLAEMSNTGFQGKSLAGVAEVFEKMIKDPDLTIFFGYAGSLSTTGQWKIVNWLIENRFIDVLIPTGANISEDIVEAMGNQYWQGSHRSDDSELFSAGLNRYYDVYGRETDYLEMTELIAEFIMTLDENNNYSSREFLKLFNNGALLQNGSRNTVLLFCSSAPFKKKFKKSCRNAGKTSFFLTFTVAEIENT